MRDLCKHDNISMYLFNFALIVLGADKEAEIEDGPLRSRLGDEDETCDSS